MHAEVMNSEPDSEAPAEFWRVAGVLHETLEAAAQGENITRSTGSYERHEVPVVNEQGIIAGTTPARVDADTTLGQLLQQATHADSWGTVLTSMGP